MFELSREVRINASPQTVWRVLTDIPGYRAWTRVVLIDGEPTVGAAINYQIAGHMRSGAQRAIRFEGEVKTVTSERELIWTTGLPGVMGLRFGFALRPAGSATDVRHYLQLSGLAAHLFRGRMTRLYGPVLGVLTEDLARRMSKTRVASLRVAPDIRRRKRKS